MRAKQSIEDSNWILRSIQKMKDEGDFGKQPAGTAPLDRRLNQTLKGMQK
jgi:hypothetical protein